jgi:outer membrane protein
MRYVAVLGLALLMSAQSTAAVEQGDWLVRIGAHNVDPKSNNHDIVEVDSGAMLTFNTTYMFRQHWGVELLAALPFSHDIDLVGGGKVAETKQLPPTASLQYHFAPNSTIRPYVGVGMNLTLFFDEQTSGALDGTNLSLGTSVGVAAQVGVDVDVSDRWYVNADVRYMNIETKAKLDGASLGDVKINPWLYGVSLGYRF